MNEPPLHRLWWHVSDKAMWLLPLWRPHCWRRREHLPWEGRCIICAAPLIDGGGTMEADPPAGNPTRKTPSAIDKGTHQTERVASRQFDGTSA